MATWKEKYNKKYQYKENKSHNLSDISKDTGISRGGLQKIYNKGIGAYKTNPQSVRPTVTSKEQWAMARVYSSVMGGKASKVDAKELKMQMGGSTNDFDRTDYYKDYYERLSPSDFVVEKENQKITINMNNKYESGGETNFNPDGNIKDKVIHASGDAGGMLVGKRHSNGGIKALNKSTGQPLEMEGGEVVITRNAVSDNKKRSFNGKMLTNRQILSEINESGGGVSFADGGKVPKNVKFDCNAEYEYGGKTMCGKDLAYAMGGVTNYSKDGNDVINVFLEKSPKEKYFGDFDDLLVSGKVISKNKFNPYIKDNMVILDSDYDWLAIKKNNTVEIDFGYGSSGLIDDIQYLIQEKAIQNGLNVKVDLLKRLASNNKYYIKNGLIALNPNYALGGEIDLFEQYDKQPKELSEIVQMYEERYLDGDMDYKDSQKFLKEVNAIGYTFDLGLDNEPYNLRPMMAKGGTIKCGSCDWSWDRKDGGDDMYVCHKCGTDNTNKYKKGGITVKNNRMKKNIMKFAKEIRKKDEKWQDALKRAKIEMNKSSSKKSSNIDSELGKLKKLMKEDEILKEYNYSKKNTRKSNKSLQNGGDVMSLGIANADAVFEKGGEIEEYIVIHTSMKPESFIKKHKLSNYEYEIDESDYDGFSRINFETYPKNQNFIKDKSIKEFYYEPYEEYAKGGKLSKDDGGRFSNYKDSVKLYYNDDRYSFTKGISTKHDKFLLVSENRLDKLKSEDNYSDGFWQYPNKDISPVPILVLQKNEWSNDLYAVPLRNYEAKDSMESGGNYVGNYMLGAISLFDRRNLSGRDADDISSYAQGTPRYAKGGEVLVDSKNINDIHKKYKNVSQLDVVGSPNGQNYAIIDGQNFNIFIDDKLKVSNNRVVGIKKPSFITGKMAKGGKLSKDDAITKALELGVDFKKDFHSQSFGNELSQLAKDTGYRKSKSSSGSLGRSFFNHLEKIYDKNSSYYDSTLKPKSYADGGDIGEYPRVYIADLEAYNSGKLQGEWLDLEDYNDSEEFNDAVQDLLDGWGVEEYAIHDVENFPSGMYSEYMSTSDFDEIFDMIELAKDNNLPIDVVMEVVSQYDESAVDEYQGQYEDGEDFAYQLIEDIGLESFSDPQYFIDITDTDRRLLAQEMADSYTEDIAYEDDGERVVEEAGLDVDEYRELDGEDDDKRDEILEEAKEIVRDEYYETWYDGLDDPYDFLVNEQGLYSDEDFFKANFIQIDYGELANALEQDYLFIENDKGLFVFNVR